MIKKQNVTGWLLSAFLLFYATAVDAQKDSLRQEVEVIKAYTPNPIDAEKINDQPVIMNPDQKKPDFNYSIYSNPVFSILSVSSLQAATIIGQPREEPGYGLVRIGVGNYNKPYGELYFNNKNNKNSIFGLHVKHLSSYGKLTLEGKDRVNTPFSENEAEMFMKYMSGKSTLSVNLGVDHNGFRYYGYPGKDPIPVFLTAGSQLFYYQGQKQTFTKGGINLNLQNIYASKSDPSSGFDFSYYRFGTKTGQREDFAKFDMNFNLPREGFSLIADAGAEYSKTTGIYYNFVEELPSEKNHCTQFWVSFKPAVQIGNETINLKAGFKTWLVFENQVNGLFKIAPDIRIKFAPVREIITVFAGIDGNYYHNHYSAVAYQNPFVSPTIQVDNHHEKFRFYGGFDGKISSKTNFRIEVDHSIFDHHPFFYLQGFRLPTMGPLPGPAFTDNTFHVLFDNMKTLKFNGEITHHAGEKLNLLVSANLYKYIMSEQEKPWNLPQFDAVLSVNYAVSDRFRVETDIYVIGKREGLLVQLDKSQSPNIIYDQIGAHTHEEKILAMNTAFDLNFRGDYEINRKLSVFGQLNNLGFQKYEKWPGYPVQSFNLLGGISYSF